jgi:hypothetical protein
MREGYAMGNKDTLADIDNLLAQNDAKGLAELCRTLARDSADLDDWIQDLRALLRKKNSVIRHLKEMQLPTGAFILLVWQRNTGKYPTLEEAEAGLEDFTSGWRNKIATSRPSVQKYFNILYEKGYWVKPRQRRQIQPKVK